MLSGLKSDEVFHSYNEAPHCKDIISVWSQKLWYNEMRKVDITHIYCLPVAILGWTPQPRFWSQAQPLCSILPRCGWPVSGNAERSLKLWCGTRLAPLQPSCTAQSVWHCVCWCATCLVQWQIWPNFLFNTVAGHCHNSVSGLLPCNYSLACWLVTSEPIEQDSYICSLRKKVLEEIP